jgi:hypothetical protein
MLVKKITDPDPDPKRIKLQCKSGFFFLLVGRDEFLLLKVPVALWSSVVDPDPQGSETLQDPDLLLEVMDSDPDPKRDFSKIKKSHFL